MRFLIVSLLYFAIQFGKVWKSYLRGVHASPEREQMARLDEYMTIKEAAEYLGVCTNTLRNWGRSGKLTERRHPMNDYRLYVRDDLDALLRDTERAAHTKLKRRKPK